MIITMCCLRLLTRSKLQNQMVCADATAGTDWILLKAGSANCYLLNFAFAPMWMLTTPPLFVRCDVGSGYVRTIFIFIVQVYQHIYMQVFRTLYRCKKRQMKTLSVLVAWKDLNNMKETVLLLYFFHLI